MGVIIIKNNTEESKTWIRDFEAGESFTLPEENPSLMAKYKTCEPLLQAIAAGEASVGDGLSFFTTVSDQLSWLKCTTTPEVVITDQKWFKDSFGYRARFKGFSSTAVAGETTNIDHCVQEESFMNGAAIILKNAITGDHADFSVVDIDGVYYEAGTVLDTFVSSWFFAGDADRQCDNMVEYPARILPGLYIRISYTSLGVENVSVFCNLRLHKVPT